ncbi:MAG: glycosyltransferase family 4 protein [Cyclobacteriaceae bacterium]
MEIIIIAFEFPPYKGGIANYSYTMAKYYAVKGLGVSVFTLNPDATSSSLYTLHKPFSRGSLGQPVILRKLISAGYICYQYLFLYRFLFRIVRAGRPRVILTSLFHNVSWNTISFLKFFGIKYELVLHGLDIYEIDRKKPVKFRNVIKSSSRLIVNSKNTKRILLEKVPDSLEPSIFYPLLDTSLIDGLIKINDDDLIESLGIKNDKKIILTVGRLVKRKGIDIAIKGLKIFLKSQPDWIYLIAGDGEEKESLVSLVNEDPTLQQKIKFLGRIPDSDKYSLLVRSSVFITINSIVHDEDVEGFGISFIEASYTKNWVIGGNNGGVIESVNTKLNGFLIDVENEPEKQIHDVMQKIADGYYSEQRLNDGKEYVIDHYSLKKFSGG